MRRAVSVRRSAAEWRRIVEEWRASGRTADAFAASRGLVVGTLKVWAWRTGKATRRRARPSRALRLVPVEVVGEETAAGATEAVPGGWELSSADGYVLKVQGDLGVEQLERVLALIGR